MTASFRVSPHRAKSMPIQPIVNLFAHRQHMGHCVIAGDAKCGTSSLYKYLCQHPSILRGAHKEINYISSLGNKTGSLLDYSKKLGVPGRGQFMTIDGSARYFRWPGNVPQTLYKLVPKSKIIILLRNPPDRLYSNYWMNQAQSKKHKEVYPTFDDYLQKYPWKTNPINTYAANLQRWHAVFPNNQILVINSQDFFEKTNKTLNIIFNFLGLSLYQVRDLSPVIPFAKEGAKPSEHYPPLSKEHRLYLMKHFEPLNKKLYEMIGRDFGWDQELVS